MNLKERLRLEEKELKNLVQAYWPFKRKPEAVKKKGEKIDEVKEGVEGELGKQIGILLES